MDVKELRSRLANRDLTRRQMLTAMNLAGLSLIAVPLIGCEEKKEEAATPAPEPTPEPTPAPVGDQATYFTWSGYDVPEFFPGYVTKHGTNPNLPIFADEQEAFQKLQAGFQVDIAHPCSGRIDRWRNAGLLAPIDTSRLSNWGDLHEALTPINNATYEGQQWFVPIDWGNTSVIYRTDLVQPKEDSWSLLWDAEYAGRLSMGEDITDTAIIGGLLVGVADPYDMTDEEIAKVKAKLAEQRDLLRFYWSDTTVLEQALASGEVVAASAWNGTLAQMNAQGIPVTWMAPKEGTLTWCCGVILSPSATQLDKAYDMIDALISQEAGVWMMTQIGYGHSNKKAFEQVGAEALAKIGLPADPSEHLANGIFSKDNARLDALQTMFEEVKAGL